MNGILFKDSMIQAIIEGRKTQTRRIIKFHKPFENPDSWEVIYPDGGGNWIAWDKDRPWLAEFTKKAYPNGEGFKSKYHIGQKLYIKEAWRTEKEYDSLSPSEIPDTASIWFEFTENLIDIAGKPRSPMFLKSKDARYFIEITNVEPQRLQEISTNEKDLRAEGIPLICYPNNRTDWTEMAYQYLKLWESINGKGSWDLNPYIWKYTFKQVK